MTKHSSDRRERLIQAAKLLIHQKGFGETTLANIAELADVPLGNVYYYFKTKDDIGKEVIKTLSQEYAARFEDWDKILDNKTRLFSFLTAAQDNLEPIIQFGCPIGGLCQELAKQDSISANLVAKILDDIINWCDKQFQYLGFHHTKASGLAQSLVSKLQGIYLLASTFKDPSLIPTQIQYLHAWLEEVISVQVNSRQKIKTKEESLLSM